MSQYEDAPLLLYIKGDSDLNPARTVSIVGTRKPTTYGKAMTENIVKGLIDYEVQIISGLAYGVDSLTHHTCVNNKMDNIAVMGTGLDKIYPAVNRSLAEKICHKGALLTEFPIATNPDRENFPMRNRIIAAMSDVVIVIQSAAQGGSLITAEFANAYYKDVFAVPGRVNDDMSIGCNKLIKSNKAHLLESIDDVAYIMRWDANRNDEKKQAELFQTLSPEEESIVNILRQHEEIAIDRLHHLSKMNLSDLAAHLLTLEFNNIVTALPGKKYGLK